MASSKAAPSFADFYTLADYVAYRVHEDSAPRDAAGKKVYDGPAYERHKRGVEPHLEVSNKACEAFLEALLRSGSIPQPDFIQGRGLPTGEALRRRIEADPEEDWLRQHDLNMHLYFSDAKDPLASFEGEGVASEDFGPLDLVMSSSEIPWVSRQTPEDAPAPQRMR